MSPTLLEVSGLEVTFRSGFGSRAAITRAVDGVGFSIARGETVGLVGESGCGKSTLVRTLFGLNPIAAGTITLDGEDIGSPRRTDRRRLSRRMQLVFQDPYSSVDPRLTVHEIVAEPLRIARQYEPATVTDILDRVGLTSAQGARRPSTLSGGQRQRVAIARSLVLEPDLLVLDEPVSALDVSVQAQVLNLLVELQQTLGLSYLFVSHDLSVVRHISDRVIVMQNGTFVETGSVMDIFENAQHPYTRMLLESAPVADPRRRMVS
ncbi:MAG: peptide/nickel transport system ATP-binding protein [Subtercola sp.]|nr:peptide/nickel transport system ATP-binding protein [Subtercola sp.]